MTVLVPWRGGCVHRERAWRWVRDSYRREHPGYRVVLAADDGEGPWVKARPVGDALAQIAGGVVVVADADVWTDGLERAVAEVEGGAPWAVPHDVVLRLDEDSTDAWYAGERVELALDRTPYRGVWGGGFIVTHRDVLESIPFDARYEGWGQEDESIGMAMWTLLGPAWRGDAKLFHLWHPPAPRRYWRTGSLEGGRLARRYRSVRNDPAGMRRLVEEGRRCCSN